MKPMKPILAVAAAAQLLVACSTAAPDAPVTAAAAVDAGCEPHPLGGRDLYLRGAFNNWAAADEQRFVWACRQFELLTDLSGSTPFKIADEDWSADADFGARGALTPAQPLALERKGPALEFAFAGQQRWTLRLPAGAAPQLSFESFPNGNPAFDLAAWRARAASAAEVGDPVARSLRFDSRDLAHKAPFGAQPAGTELEFAVAAAPGVQRVTLVVEKRRLEGNQEVLEYREVARVPLALQDGRWRGRHRLAEPAVYGYWFEVEIGGRLYALQNNRDPIYWTREKGSGGVGAVEPLPDHPKRIRRFRQTVFAADFEVPAYAPDLVYYYVFPDRFRNGDPRNDPRPGSSRYHDKTVEFHADWLDKPYRPGSGDGSDAVFNNDFFGGDLQGLIDKLDDIAELGANALYITPLFSAASNHKYDTGDYRRIDPAFGSNEDFARLAREAGRRGIRVIPDTSLNHTGSDSIYFDRFGRHPGVGAFEGGRIRADSPYAGWFRFDPAQTEPDKQYRGWVGVADLPELDKASKDFRRFAYGEGGVMQQWLDLGAAGWRMDVAPWVPDDFWREWRAAVKRHRPDAITIAETWFDASKFFLGDSFDSTMNYIFRNTVLDYAAGGDARKLYANIELMREQYPKQAFYALMNLVSSHDQARALHVLGARDDSDPATLALAKQRLRLAMLFQSIFPGSPAIYYGDEVGVGGGEDPYNRATYPWPDRGGRPDMALRADFKQMLAMRKAHPVLRHGSIAAPLLIDEHLIVLAREQAEAFAITATNNARSERQASVRLPAAQAGRRFVDALSGAVVQADGDTLRFAVPPLSGVVLVAR